MKTKPIIFFATVLATAALGGCTRETTSSANIRTPGIAALIDVTAEDSTNSTVHVELRVGGSSSNTFVNLESGDRLTASADDDVKDMRSDDTAGEYEAEFATAAAGTEFKVMFERDVDEDALGNRGTMPAPFEITGVPTSSPSRAKDDVVITWDPAEAGSKMEIEVTGSCIFSETIDVPGDKGTHTISKGTLESTGGDMPKECDLDVKVTRTATGSADKIFDDESWFRLHQVRRETFTSKP